MKVQNNKTALVYAVDLLAVRAYSEKQLTDKLKRRGYDKAEIATAMEKLLNRRYIDDSDLCQRQYTAYINEQKRSIKAIFYKLKEKGQKRYAEKIPPGWKDASKSENRYGDYINWEEILRLAVNEKKSIIFITNDTKSDWIEEIEGKKIGPLHALSQEFCERVNNADQLFYIYTLDKFLEFTQDHNKTLDSPKTIIENVKNILQESTAFEIGSNSKMNIETSHSNKESGPDAEKVSSSDEYKIKSEPVKSEPAQSEPVKGESAKSEPVKDEPAKGEPAKGEPVKDEPAKGEPVKDELAKDE